VHAGIPFAEESGLHSRRAEQMRHAKVAEILLAAAVAGAWLGSGSPASAAPDPPPRPTMAAASATRISPANDGLSAADAAERTPLPPDLANAPLPRLNAVAAAIATAPPNSVGAFGDAPAGTGSIPDGQPLTGVAATPSGNGYWVIAGDGGVFTYGDARFFGSAAPLRLSSPVVAIAATPDGGGYWLLTGDGRVFAFGDAPFLGAIVNGDNLPTRFVSMATTPDGGGYWLTTTDGHVTVFGSAPTLPAAVPPGATVAAISASPTGQGYRLVTTDGRVFSFGDAQFAGSIVGAPAVPIVGLAATPSGMGYWLLAADGTVSAFGDAALHGSSSATTPAPAVAIAGTPTGRGYLVAYGLTVGSFSQDALDWLGSRADKVSAGVYDVTTDRTYLYGPDTAVHTASIVKVDIMATLFAEVQAAGRSLSGVEVGLLALMIHVSSNAAASDLWREVGAGAAVAAFNRSIPMPNTTMGPDGLWGLTLTTGLDQVALVRTLDASNPVLMDAYRSVGLGLMEGVIPSQRWGISAGVPPGVTVAIKNGWLPLTGSGWITNSIGIVEGQGRHYVIAVLTEDNPSESYGITTIEGLASRVWANPAGG
jgi:hypothetical protein